jgi:2-polyprenyl-3-methyl-5-hydroxy-6-metoxy-1,4-benzoquinol methylase
MRSPSYDELWQTVWGDMQRFGPVHRHILENLVHTVSSLDVLSILDVGCGSGENLAALAALNRYELTGVDVSPEALKLAKLRAPLARLVLLDVTREALPEQFDLVTSIQVVEHLLDDVAAFRNIARMTRSYVFLSTMQGRMRPSEIDIGHVRNYSAVELKRKLEYVGLEVIEMSGWGAPFYSPLYRSLVEWLPGGPPKGAVGPIGRFAAQALYYLYRFNWPNRGDVISVLARRSG